MLKRFIMAVLLTAAILPLGAADLQSGNYIVQVGSSGTATVCYCTSNGEGEVGNLVVFTLPHPAWGSGYHTHETTGTKRSQNISLNRSSCTTGANGCCSVNALVPWYAGNYFIDAYAQGVPYTLEITLQVQNLPLPQFFSVPSNVSWLADAGHSSLNRAVSSYEAAAMPLIFSEYADPITILRAATPWGGWLDSNIMGSYFPANVIDSHLDGHGLDVAIPGPQAEQNKLSADVQDHPDMYGGDCKVIVYSGPSRWHLTCE